MREAFRNDKIFREQVGGSHNKRMIWERYLGGPSLPHSKCLKADEHIEESRDPKSHSHQLCPAPKPSPRFLRRVHHPPTLPLLPPAPPCEASFCLCPARWGPELE